MMDLGYALSQGVAGAAQAGVSTADLQIKQNADAVAANRELDMKVRLMAAQEAMTQRAEDRKRQIELQRGQSIQKGATGLLASSDAGAINSSLGSNIDPTNPDSAATLAAIRANPAAAQAYGLKDDTDIDKSARRAQAARDLGDLPAAKEEDLNRATLRKEQLDKAKGERDETRLDILDRAQRAQADRQSTLAEATLAHQKRMGESADARASEQVAREQRAATATALKSVTDDLKTLEKDTGSIENMDPKKQEAIRGQMDSMRREAEGYRKALAAGGLPGVPGPAAPGPGATAPPLDSFDRSKKQPPAAAPQARAGLLPSETPPAMPPREVNPAGLLAANSDLTQISEKALWAMSNQSGPTGDAAIAELKRRGLTGAPRVNARSFFDG